MSSGGAWPVGGRGGKGWRWGEIRAGGLRGRRGVTFLPGHNQKARAGRADGGTGLRRVSVWGGFGWNNYGTDWGSTLGGAIPKANTKRCHVQGGIPLQRTGRRTRAGFMCILKPRHKQCLPG